MPDVSAKIFPLMFHSCRTSCQCWLRSKWRQWIFIAWEFRWRIERWLAAKQTFELTTGVRKTNCRNWSVAIKQHPSGKTCCRWCCTSSTWPIEPSGVNMPFCFETKQPLHISSLEFWRYSVIGRGYVPKPKLLQNNVITNPSQATHVFVRQVTAPVTSLLGNQTLVPEPGVKMDAFWGWTYFLKNDGSETSNHLMIFFRSLNQTFGKTCFKSFETIGLFGFNHGNT